MRAEARIVAESDRRGGTRLAVLRGESPLLLRRTGPRTGGAVTVHLVGGAAGPLRGDDLRLDIEVGPGARLARRQFDTRRRHRPLDGLQGRLLR